MVGNIKRPPGPPPNAPPINTLKPPPLAPPPRNLTQTQERPGVETIGVKRAADEKPDASSPPAPSKPSNFVPAPQHKAGAISMFEGSEEYVEQAQADKKPKIGPPRGPPPNGPPMARQPRALPPRANPPGIPEGQPLPPEAKPERDGPAPPPVRPPPKTSGGGRAPPKEEAKDIISRGGVVPPPETEPPLLRIKKKKVEEVVKRRDKDMPEFESSDEDEEDPNFVKQPLPFGVLKQPIPVSTLSVKKPAEAPKEVEPEPHDAPEDNTAKSSKMDDTPSMGLLQNKQSAFVPAAPAGGIDSHYDDSKLGKTLTRGRLSIKCIEGYDIRRKDDQDKIPRNDPFIKFRLGVVERHPWKSTEAKRKQDANPNFENEVVFFDILDPAQFIFQEDLQICIELWNKSTTKNDLVGSVTMSVVRFLKKPFVSYTEKVPIYYPGMTRTMMKVGFLSLLLFFLF